MAGLTHEVEPRKGYRTWVGRLFVTCRGVADNLAHGMRQIERRSYLRWFLDVFHYRLLRVLPIGAERRHTIYVAGGIKLSYAANRGDIRALVETWFEEAYALPVDIKHGGNIVDLGANIGATSVWLARRFECRRLIAVEPSSRNVRLTRLNLAQNSIPGEVVEAAIGPEDGVAYFAEDDDSMLGRLGSSGTRIPVISMPTLLQRFSPEDRISVLKMDVEGAEADLLDGDLSWLARVDSVVAEIHADRIDADRFVRGMEAAGFAYRYLEHAKPRYGPLGKEFVGLFLNHTARGVINRGALA
jgi:FkbM family methyltransferase